MAKHESASSRSYFAVFAALMALAAVGYGISFASLGAMRVPVAIAISVAKASLVAVFFMELIDQRSTNRFVLAAALILVCTLIALMAADVLTRGIRRCCHPGEPLEPSTRRARRGEPRGPGRPPSVETVGISGAPPHQFSQTHHSELMTPQASNEKAAKAYCARAAALTMRRKSGERSIRTTEKDEPFRAANIIGRVCGATRGRSRGACAQSRRC